MPAKKHTKAKHIAGEALEIKEKPSKSPGRQSRLAGTTDDRQPPPDRNKREIEIDEELAITFLTEYHAIEQALVRAGFARAGRIPGSTQPDWERFVRHIERRFRPDSSEELQAAVSYLLIKPSLVELREQRLEYSFPWETASPRSDMIWLSELVQQVRNKLVLGINFPQSSGCDTATTMAALLVMEAWAYTDPQVERLLTFIH